MVYLAEHPAMAMLEVRVHLDLPFELLPADYVMIRVNMPDRMFSRTERLIEVPADTAAAGDAWLTDGRAAAWRVPSVLLPNAWNVLLNPSHPDASRVRIVAIEPFRFDPRLWHPLAGEG